MHEKVILVKAPALVEDLCEVVTSLTIAHINNDICETFVLNKTVDGNDVGISGGKSVETNLTSAIDIDGLIQRCKHEEGISRRKRWGLGIWRQRRSERFHNRPD